MILTSLPHAVSHECLGKRFRSAFEWLRTNDLPNCPLGRHSIDGDDVYALVQENMTKPQAQCRWEAHRRFADIQYIVTGIERMGCAPLELFDVEIAYDDSSDVGFFRPAAPAAEAHITIATVPPGHFALFLPSDVHMPLIAAGAPIIAKKIVVKVRV